MKHIKKKYYFEGAKPPIQDGKEMLSARRDDVQELRKIKKDNIPFLHTTEDTYIMSMFHNYNGQETVIPIPDLTLVYYNNAYLSNNGRKKMEKQLFGKLRDTSAEVSESVTEELYQYIGLATSTIIQMFTSIESFINHLIPDNKPYINIRKDRTEHFNKEQIQIHIRFWDKINDVLPYYENKNFFKTPTPTNAHLRKLKDIRDAIVHTKSNHLFVEQSKLIDSLLKFKYDDTLQAIRKFMNFHKPNYIVDCDCNADF
jgi:hypothetical protein